MFYIIHWAILILVLPVNTGTDSTPMHNVLCTNSMIDCLTIIFKSLLKDISVNLTLGMSFEIFSVRCW